MATGEDRQESALDLANDCGWVRALDASGKSIRIEKSVLVELIRREMPVASNTEKGLAEVFVNPKYFVLRARESIEINIPEYGFYSITSNNLSGKSCIVCVSYYESDAFEQLGSISDIANIKLKGAGIKTLVITSLSSHDNAIIVNRV